MKQRISKIWLFLVVILAGTINCACNVTREVTSKSEYFQKGDTTVTIQTKTIETYNAQKQ